MNSSLARSLVENIKIQHANASFCFLIKFRDEANQGNDREKAIAFWYFIDPYLSTAQEQNNTPQVNNGNNQNTNS
jgi:hypothetical protein